MGQVWWGWHEGLRYLVRYPVKCWAAVCDVSLEVRGVVCAGSPSVGFCPHVSDKPRDWMRSLWMRLWIEKSETFDIWVAYTFRGSNSEEEPANEPENKHASASR